MIQDLRFGLRMLLKQPAFTLVAVLTLALGIGSTSAVFSLIQGVLLTPPPYRQPQRLVLIPGYEFWQRQYNGDPHIIGKTIRISRWDTPPKVIGVMPPGVRFLPSPGNAQEPNYNVNALVDFWIPASPHPARLKDPFWNV